MGFLDSLFKSGASKAEEFNFGNYQKFNQLYQSGTASQPGILPYLMQSLGKAEQPMLDSVSVAKEGASEANRMIGARGAESYRAIQDMATQGASGAKQAAISSGLGNTSAAASAQAQAMYQGARAAGQLGEGLAGQSAQTALAGSARVSSALQGLAGYYSNRGSQYANTAGQYAQGLGNYQMQAGEAPIQALLGIAGQAAGGWAYGGFK